MCMCEREGERESSIYYFKDQNQNIKPNFIAVHILCQKKFNCGQLTRPIHLMPFEAMNVLKKVRKKFESISKNRQ